MCSVRQPNINKRLFSLWKQLKNTWKTTPNAKLHKLGNHSVEKTIDELPRITNCPVIEIDVRNAMTIFGPLLSHLKGKTTQSKNAVVPLTTRPRREEHQQIFIDLAYWKYEPFLLAFPFPLELKIVEYSEDPRSAASIKQSLDHIKANH